MANDLYTALLGIQSFFIWMLLDLVSDMCMNGYGHGYDMSMYGALLPSFTVYNWIFNALGSSSVDEIRTLKEILE